MAYETKSQIVPFAITGTYKLFSKDLKIKFGKPIKIKSNNLEKETEKLRNIIIKMVSE
jgi:1-acyl-sn-glycerol-3-phosphate acyltransferase